MMSDTRQCVGALKPGDKIAFTTERDRNVTAVIIRKGGTITLVRDCMTKERLTVFNHMMVTVLEAK